MEQSSDVGLQDCEISDNYSELINDDILNDVNTSMVNLSLDPNEVLTCSTPVQQSPPQALGADVPPPSCFDHHDMENSVSTLWSSVSSSSQKEIEIGLISPREMANHHHIVPNANVSVRRNPSTFNPFKVYQYNLGMYFSHYFKKSKI